MMSDNLHHISMTRGDHGTRSFLRYDVRKYSFTQRTVNIWNSLPGHVVNPSPVNSFKNNLDKFWISQEVYYNSKCDITGT